MRLGLAPYKLQVTGSNKQTPSTTVMFRRQQIWSRILQIFKNADAELNETTFGKYARLDVPYARIRRVNSK